MSEETKDIEETKVAEEKKMETEQTILSQPTEKKAAETVTQIQQSGYLRGCLRISACDFPRNSGTEEKFYPIKEKSGSVQRRTDSFQD